MAAPKSAGVSQLSYAREFIHTLKNAFDAAYKSNPASAVDDVSNTYHAEYSTASQLHQVNVCKILEEEFTIAEAQVRVKEKAVEKLRVKIQQIKNNRNALEDAIDNMQEMIDAWSNERDRTVCLLESNCLKGLKRARGELVQEQSNARLWAARVDLYGRLNPDAIQVLTWWITYDMSRRPRVTTESVVHVL